LEGKKEVLKDHVTVSEDDKNAFFILGEGGQREVLEDHMHSCFEDLISREAVNTNKSNISLTTISRGWKRRDIETKENICLKKGNRRVRRSKMSPNLLSKFT
jgi:hypothetical protein